MQKKLLVPFAAAAVTHFAAAMQVDEEDFEPFLFAEVADFPTKCKARVEKKYPERLEQCAEKFDETTEKGARKLEQCLARWADWRETETALCDETCADRGRFRYENRQKMCSRKKDEDVKATCLTEADEFLQGELIRCCQMETKKTYRAGMQACNEKYEQPLRRVCKDKLREFKPLKLAMCEQVNPFAQVPSGDCADWAADLSFENADYQTSNAECKLQWTWEKITSDSTPAEFGDENWMKKFFQQDANATFDHNSDVMPEGREKSVHIVGLHATFKFVSAGEHMYTGSLKGTEHGIIRLSDTGPQEPSAETIPSASAALKFFRNGKESGNVVLMSAFEGHPETYDFLDVNYWTNLEIPVDNQCELKTRMAKMREASEFIATVSTKELTEIDQDGNEEAEAVWPFELQFVPRREVRESCKNSAEFTVPFYDQLGDCVKAGTTLFDVYAWEDPGRIDEEEDIGEKKVIGSIITTSDFVTSAYGDSQLFFKHGRFEDDIEENGEDWLNGIKNFFDDHQDKDFTASLDGEGRLPLPVESGCPFSFLFGEIIQ